MNLLERIVAARRASIALARRNRAAGGEQTAAPEEHIRNASRDGVSAAEGASRQYAPQEGARTRDGGSPHGAPREGGRAPQVDARYGVDQEFPGGSEIAQAQRSAAPRLFEAALRAPGRRIIAEIKRRSPSRGPIRDPLDPRAIAAQYARAGAAAISVLTEPEFFGGSDADLVAARDAVTLPVLRKDFILDAGQIAESRALGADAVLLIAAVLAPEELALLVSEAHRSGMAALVEVHDERELDAALASGTKIVGVNSRDLRDFSVDLERAVRLARRIPSDLVAVAESGIRDVADIERLEDAGYRAFLVGESLLGAPDPGAALGELLA